MQSFFHVFFPLWFIRSVGHKKKKGGGEWLGSRAVDDVVDLVLHQHVTFFFLSLFRKQMLEKVGLSDTKCKCKRVLLHGRE